MKNTLFLAALMFITSHSYALQVDNFVLLDHQGDAHELHYHRQAPAIVIMSQANGCNTVTQALPAYQALQDKFANSGTTFWMLNSSLNDERDEVYQEAQRLGINVPILQDDTQLIGEALKASQAGEVLVIDPRSWQVVFRGPLSGARAQDPSQPSAAHSIETLLSGQPATPQIQPVQGCEISLPESAC